MRLPCVAWATSRSLRFLISSICGKIHRMPLLQKSTPLVPIRAVHLDLKGVPPTAARLLSLLSVYKAAGYNAVLVEWEDQFPWTVDQRFRNETAYTPEQVLAFCTEAHRLDIEIVPLVQCLGHMETPLSIADYAKLREVPDRSDVLNPLAPGARELVEKMIDDVLKLVPSPKYFHLGGDEAWTFGTHPDTKAYIEKHGKGALYLHHVEPLLDKLHAWGIRPILWHDMMLHWDDEALKRLAQKADLMVWGYSGRVDQTKGHHSLANFTKLKNAGLTLWGATAYKGGDGHDIDLPDAEVRQTNAQGYADVANQFDLQGICATGWSRYSTHRVQCEPIDAALDVLLNIGAILHDGSPAKAENTVDCLKQLGELDRFNTCKQVMEQLTKVRLQGWRAVQDIREQAVMVRQDPRRNGAKAEQHYLGALVKVIRQADSVSEETRKAFAELIPQLWIDRYLGERLEPLREELKSV
jgi:hypothetical protein